MLGWLLNLIYAALMTAVMPVVLYRMLVQGKYRAGWGQKLFGTLPRPAEGEQCLWLHAVSVGEVVQLRPVVAGLRQAHPDLRFVISTTTSTGWEVARQSFPDDRVCYFPLDFTWAVRRSLQRLRPVALVLVELELWPNLIRAASRQDVPVVLINGRLTEKSFRGYRRIRFLLRGILQKFDTLAMQNETYSARIRQLGAPAERVQITGSIKFDAIETDRNNPRTLEIRRSFGIADDELIFLAGSTQSPEEAYAIDAYQELKSIFPNLRLLLVPRHKERFEEVARLISERGLPLFRRSETTNATANTSPQPVLLLDTLGELSACWGVADVAFVGGSLTNRGGQNMIEPAGYGAAILFGPNTHNFRDVVDDLLRNEAARVVHGPGELTATVREFLESPQQRQELGQRAQRLVVEQRGATARTVELISGAIGQRTTLRLARAA